MSRAPAVGPSSRSGALARVVRRLEAVPLRRRLVAIVGTLVGAALVITSLATAYTMRANLRAGDSIYRVGGEEILVVLPGATKVDAVDIAERLRLAVRDLRPVGVTMTVSIGVAVSPPGSFDTDDLFHRADEALYTAKANGRDMVFAAAAAN